MSGAPITRRMKQRLQGTQSSPAPVETCSESLLNASSPWPLLASASVRRRAGAAGALKGFLALGKLIDSAPKAWPAPKAWIQDGDTRVEYIYYPAGVIGFELIRETAKVVSTSPDKAGTDADAVARP